MSQRRHSILMPRMTLKKLFLYLFLSGSGLLLVMNLHQKLFPALNKQELENNKKLNYSTNRRLTVKEKPQQTPQTSTTRDALYPTSEPFTSPPSSTKRGPMALNRLIKMNPTFLDIPPDSNKPWYMHGGQLCPKNSVINSTSGTRNIQIFPEEVPGEDRIPDQLMYLPPAGTLPENQEEPSVPLKKILLWNGASSWGGLKPGRGVFLKEKCPVSACVLSSSRAEAESADLVLFKDHFSMPKFKRPSSQLWMLYLLECPLHTQIFKEAYMFNWTATYRTDSTVVAPYERWQYYNENVKTIKQEKNYAANKTKQVAWFVSNCGARNGRLSYARELSKYISVDIYGACGPKRCARSSNSKCFDLLDRDYKFYLAFENSNCKDYITEKFFVNGLGHDILPIAMGARPEDYEATSPYKSYLHVDQFSGPKELAEYLHKLDEDDHLYNQYFQWKGTGEFINTKFWCRLCGLLHDTKKRSVEQSYYKDINEWWRGDGICANSGWKNKSDKTTKESSNKITTKTSRFSQLMGA